MIIYIHILKWQKIKPTSPPFGKTRSDFVKACLPSLARYTKNMWAGRVEKVSPWTHGNAEESTRGVGWHRSSGLCWPLRPGRNIQYGTAPIRTIKRRVQPSMTTHITGQRVHASHTILLCSIARNRSRRGLENIVVCRVDRETGASWLTKLREVPGVGNLIAINRKIRNFFYRWINTFSVHVPKGESLGRIAIALKIGMYNRKFQSLRDSIDFATILGSERNKLLKPVV